MNQDSSFPPMLPPSTELSALLFAVLPCLQESYRPLASFAYHMTELTKLKSIPSIPALTGLSGIDALITDKDSMLRSLSFYGKMFHMPLLSTIANLLQAMQFYQAYKDIIPGLVSSMGGGNGDSGSPLSNMAGLLSGSGGLSGLGGSSDIFSMLGGLSPDLLSSLFSGFSNSSASNSSASNTAVPPKPQSNVSDTPVASETSPITEVSSQSSETNENEQETTFPEHNRSESSGEAQTDSSETTAEASDDLYNNLYSFLTPEQKQIYEQLMHTD